MNRCLMMPAEYNTVVTRAKLAQKMHESATKEIKKCEKLVFEQHLQQQGWAAVMANLEDVTNEFKQRSQVILNTINDYLEKRPKYLEYLTALPDDLAKLSTVPILNELMPSAQHEFHGFDDYYHDNASYTGGSTSADSGTSVGGSSNNSRNRESLSGCDSGGAGDSSSQLQPGQLDNATGSTAAATAKAQPDKVSNDSTANDTPKNRSLTLLQWISSKENHKSLDEMAKHCSEVLSKFDDVSITQAKDAIKRNIDIAEQVRISFSFISNYARANQHQYNCSAFSLLACRKACVRWVV